MRSNDKSCFLWVPLTKVDINYVYSCQYHSHLVASKGNLCWHFIYHYSCKMVETKVSYRRKKPVNAVLHGTMQSYKNPITLRSVK